jgi:hypothetical protein
MRLTVRSWQQEKALVFKFRTTSSADKKQAICFVMNGMVFVLTNEVALKWVDRTNAEEEGLFVDGLRASQ